MFGMSLPLSRTTLTAFALVLALAACDTAEERAESHFENALELIEAGDTARARVELRSVFDLVPNHQEARETFAKLLYDEGEYSAAFGQYERLIEVDPDALLPRYVVAELLVLDNAFERAQVHLDAVQRLAPDEERAQVLANVSAYREAVIAEDVEARRAARTRAMALSESLPDNKVNNTVIADAMIIDEDFDELFEQLDRMLATYPEERRFHMFRLTGYGRAGDPDGIEQTLRTMIDTFPEDEILPETLMRFYSSRGDIDGAETFLRSRIIPGEENDSARGSLIRFISVTRGAEAALEEARRFIAEGTNNELFNSIEASVLYDMGERDQALDLFEGIVTRAAPSAQANNIKATYAELLQRDGNEVGARALIEDVLAEDSSHVRSLLMRADWLISDDRADDAVLALRTAQDQDPENPEIFSKLAEAYLRNGERTLAGEMLSLASSTSNRAPAPSIRYARFLRSDGRLRPAEGVLIDSLRLAPGNTEILIELGDLYIAMEDWGRASDIERELRERTDPQLVAAADRLRLASLRGQDRNDEAVAFLENFTEGDNRSIAAEIAIAETLLDDGKPEEARDHIRALLEENPDNPNVAFALSRANIALRDFDEAARILRTLIDAGATGEQVWIDLIRSLNLVGRSEEARATLNEALVAAPASLDLKWMQASFLERDGDFEAAIAVYEELYTINDNSPIVANNLASLLTSVRQDPESLDRADRIARRLRGTEVPAFQDTYGWIRYLQGDYAEALEYLRPAAEALGTDAMVQVHLGLTLAALNRTDDAIAQINRALEMAPDDPRPAFDTARQRLAELQNSDTGAGSDTTGGSALPSDSENTVGE